MIDLDAASLGEYRTRKVRAGNCRLTTWVVSQASKLHSRLERGLYDRGCSSSGSDFSNEGGVFQLNPKRAIQNGVRI
jgi:hypothetical protein